MISLTRAQKVTLLVFFSILSAMIALGIGYDLYLASTGPDDATTESWAMDLLGFGHPIVTYVLGWFSCLFTAGLAIHMWWGQPTPALWKEVVDRRWQMGQLESQGIAIPVVPPNLDYN
jgi:hypothetical protein